MTRTVLYSTQVMRGVIEEKTSRVVEILVSSVKPFELMMGKIVAIGLVGLTQFFIWIVLATGLLIAIQTFIFTEVSNPENWNNIEQFSTIGNMNNVSVNDLVVQSEWANVIYNMVPWDLLLSLFFFYFI